MLFKYKQIYLLQDNSCNIIKVQVRRMSMELTLVFLTLDFRRAYAYDYAETTIYKLRRPVIILCKQKVKFKSMRLYIQATKADNNFV